MCSTHDTEVSASQPAGHYEHFARLIEQDRSLILAEYERSLVELRSPIIGDPHFREQALANGAQALDDVTESVRANAIRINAEYKLLAWAMGETRAANELWPTDTLPSAVALFNTVVRVLARHIEADPALLPAHTIALVTLNESINRRIRESTLAYTWYLLGRIQTAHVDERHRIARELHDRLGEGVSGALRQLELHELTEPERPDESRLCNALAKRALVEVMDHLHIVISDLRRDFVTSLGKALGDYIASTATDVDVRLHISGDERWAPPTVIDETYLILREAVRNALAHGEPQLLLVGVDLAPHELHAWVEDDGRGFDPCGPDLGAGSAGLDTMRERAALIGGKLTVTSSPGEGTQIDLLLPLPGRRGERPH